MKNLVAMLALACVFSAIVMVIAWAPPAIGFGVVIAGAAGWCRWLDRRQLLTSDPPDVGTQ
jgi:hypothetical protein